MTTNPYAHRNSKPCTSSIQLPGNIFICCDLVEGHKGMHKTEVRDVTDICEGNEKIFVLSWRSKRGED